MMKLVALLTLLYSVSVAAQFCSDTSSSWRDIANSDCSWYDEESALRCPFANQLRARNRVSANDVCCACGGGNVSDPNVGNFYIQSKISGRFLALNSSGSVTTRSSQHRRAVITVENAPGTDEYYIKFFNGRYLSFYPNPTDVSTWTSPGAWETFEKVGFVNMIGNAGSGLKNKRWGNFLTITSSVGTANGQMAQGTEFDFIPVNSADIVFSEEEGDEMEE